MIQTGDSERQFFEREKRVTDAINLRVPDRVPIISLGDFYLGIDGGLTYAECLNDYDKLADAWIKGMQKYNWDMSAPTHSLRPRPVYEIMGSTAFQLPGWNLSTDGPYQYLESDYMKEDEFDELLSDPTGYTIRKLIPRLSNTLKPLENLPDLKILSNAYYTAQVIPGIAAQLIEVGQKLKEAAGEHLRWLTAHNKIVEDLKTLGYPMLTMGSGYCAFDWVSDMMRGLKGSMMDMFRRPEKLKAVCDIFLPVTIENNILQADRGKSKRCLIPMHRGAKGFMSDAQFEEFYWPYAKQLFLELMDRGYTPVPFFEGDYNPRLKYLAELPPGKILGHFDQVDIKKYKEILGDVMCFWGNVPSSLLCTGTPDQVKDYVKKLIDTLGNNGGLIVDACTTGPPPQSKRECVEAMTEVVFEYGKN